MASQYARRDAPRGWLGPLSHSRGGPLHVWLRHAPLSRYGRPRLQLRAGGPVGSVVTGKVRTGSGGAGERSNIRFQ